MMFKKKSFLSSIFRRRYRKSHDYPPTFGWTNVKLGRWALSVSKTYEPIQTIPEPESPRQAAPYIYSDSDTVIRGLLFDREYPGTLDFIIRNGKVKSIKKSSDAPCDLGGQAFLIAPTLMDIQVNGAIGIDLQAPGLTVDHIRNLTLHLAKNGVSRWVPTIITGDPELMTQNASIIAEARKEPDLLAAIPGIHFEGPFISPEDGPRGAHPRQYVTAPDIALFDRLDEASGHSTLYVTLAPDQPGALELIAALRERKVLVSLGHHNATAEQIHAAADAGATMCTHLGNGAAPQMHRHHNPLWPQMADDRLTASLIADGHHLPPDALQSIIRAKTPKRVVLVSDAVHLAGMSPGLYDLFDAKVELRADGKVCLLGTDLLAGSGKMLLDGVHHVIAHKMMSARQAFVASCNFSFERPLRTDYYGNYYCHYPPRAGHPADFLLIERRERKNASTWRLAASFIRGGLHLPHTSPDGA